jgi:hypothetical protein
VEIEDAVKQNVESKMPPFKRLIKKVEPTTIKKIFSFAIIGIVAVSSLYFANRLTSPVGNPQKSKAATATASVANHSF